jgi:hypothetical protein
MKEELAMRRAKENPKYKTTSSPISETSDVFTKKKRKFGGTGDTSIISKLQHGAEVGPQDREALTDLLLLSEASSVQSSTPNKRQKIESTAISSETPSFSRISTVTSASSTLATAKQKEQHTQLAFKDERSEIQVATGSNEPRPSCFETEFIKQIPTLSKVSSIPFTSYTTQTGNIISESQPLSSSSVHGTYMRLPVVGADLQSHTRHTFSPPLVIQTSPPEPKKSFQRLTPYFVGSMDPSSPVSSSSSTLSSRGLNLHQLHLQQQQPQQSPLPPPKQQRHLLSTVPQQSLPLPSLETLIHQKLPQLDLFDTVYHQLCQKFTPECSLSFYQTNQPSVARPTNRFALLAPLLQPEFLLLEHPPFPILPPLSKLSLPLFSNLPPNFSEI